MKLSVIVLHYKIDNDDDVLLNNTIKSFGNNDYEIIIADEKTDFVTKKINNAIKKTTGDFIIITGNDNPLVAGRLHDLCDSNSVTIAKVDGQSDRVLMTVTCFPRWVLEKIDYYDEAFQVYCSDEDVLMKLKQNAIPVKCVNEVEVRHSIGGRTTGRLSGYDLINERDKQIFSNKWKTELK